MRVRTAGTDYAFAVEFVDDIPARVAIDEACLEKYGRWEKRMFPEARGETHETYGRLSLE